MIDGSPTDELDRLIAAAQEAGSAVASIRRDLIPDENGVVARTGESAANAAARLEAQIALFEENGLSVASVIDDSIDTLASYRELAELTDRIRTTLVGGSAGHSDGDLVQSATEDASAPRYY